MPGTFAKVKTVVLIVTAPVWLPLWCLSMPFIVWLYFLYIVTRRIAYALGFSNSYPYFYSRAPYGVGLALHYREGHGPRNV